MTIRPTPTPHTMTTAVSEATRATANTEFQANQMKTLGHVQELLRLAQEMLGELQEQLEKTRR